MSWYFPLAVVWPYKREELAAMSIKQVDIPIITVIRRDKTEK